MGVMAGDRASNGQSYEPEQVPTSDQPGHPAGPSKPRRRFVPQLEETSVKSSHKARPNQEPKKSPADTPSKPRRRFAPQLEETTVRSSHKTADPSPPPPTPAEAVANTAPDRRRPRFAPQLIETAQRTRRRGDPESRQKSETDFSPGDTVHVTRHPQLKQREASFSQEVAVDGSEEAPTSRFSYANLAKSRRSSARKPTLECIHSSESEGDKVPSLSHSPSAKSEDPDHHKNAWQVRESCDERFAGYLLAHAARLAERQLQEQAMTAYLNERHHEPVDHFAGARDGDDSGSEEGFGLLSQVQSSSNLARHKGAPGWDPDEKQQHQEALERQRLEHRASQKRHAARQREVHNETHGAPEHHPAEIRRMRDAARPPLLGKSLVFPNCPSPKPTRIDAYQKPRLRKYDDDDSAPSREPSGLWIGCAASPDRTRQTSVVSAGLWGGYCDAAVHEVAAIPGRLLQSGLLTPGTSTPTHELADTLTGGTLQSSLLSPLMLRSIRSNQGLPATPPPSVTEMSGIDNALSREAALDAEFPDCFVTQVYNYLSLGYPALAQKYDEELGKISKMPLEEIRRNDGPRAAKGFLGTPERVDSSTQLHNMNDSDTNLHAVESRDDAHDACGRWRALRLYIREWGRQEGRMQERAVQPGQQVVRRGSWRA